LAVLGATVTATVLSRIVASGAFDCDGSVAYGVQVVAIWSPALVSLLALIPRRRPIVPRLATRIGFATVALALVVWGAILAWSILFAVSGSVRSPIGTLGIAASGLVDLAPLLATSSSLAILSFSRRALRSRLAVCLLQTSATCLASLACLAVASWGYCN
jgi:hypothetical protein